MALASSGMPSANGVLSVGVVNSYSWLRTQVGSHAAWEQVWRLGVWERERCPSAFELYLSISLKVSRRGEWGDGEEDKPRWEVGGRCQLSWRFWELVL